MVCTTVWQAILVYDSLFVQDPCTFFLVRCEALGTVWGHYVILLVVLLLCCSTYMVTVSSYYMQKFVEVESKIERGCLPTACWQGLSVRWGLPDPYFRAINPA